MKTEKINEQELNNLELAAETLNELEQTELKGGAGAQSRAGVFCSNRCNETVNDSNKEVASEER